MSFATDVLISRAPTICLIKAPAGEERKPAWYYIVPFEGQAEHLARSVTSGPTQLTDYGRIIISGYGESPPDDVVAYIKSTYGFAS